MTKTRDNKIKARKMKKVVRQNSKEYNKMMRKRAINRERLEDFIQEAYDCDTDVEEITKTPVKEEQQDEWVDCPLAWSIFNFVFKN
jgi:translation initiation factor 2B subunit (eIF-2B alpha/beta/delta family)